MCISPQLGAGGGRVALLRASCCEEMGVILRLSILSRRWEGWSVVRAVICIECVTRVSLDGVHWSLVWFGQCLYFSLCSDIIPKRSLQHHQRLTLCEVVCIQQEVTKAWSSARPAPSCWELLFFLVFGKLPWVQHPKCSVWAVGDPWRPLSLPFAWPWAKPSSPGQSWFFPPIQQDYLNVCPTHAWEHWGRHLLRKEAVTAAQRAHFCSQSFVPRAKSLEAA